MSVLCRLVPMQVAVTRPRWGRCIMLVLMMRVVLVLVGVLHRLVAVQVRVALGQMQPDAGGHQGSRRGQR